MGFTQRQAGGRFTRDEADEFIERLQGAESDPGSQSRSRDGGTLPKSNSWAACQPSCSPSSFVVAVGW